MDKYQNIEENLERYKGVVFDLDETLVDLNVDWDGLKGALSELVMKEKGVEISFTPLDQQIQKVKEKFGEPFFFRLLELISRFELCEEKYELNHELISLLKFCKEKRIAIYSMNTDKCVRNFVEKYLEKEPDIIISKDNCIEPKPTGKDLEKIIKEWKMSANEVVYIGNSENDRLCGEKARIKTHIISF